MQELRASHVGEKEIDTSGVQVMTNSGLTPRKTRLEEEEMSPVVSIMQPILRFLQLLCENHNRDLQVSYSDLSRFLLKITQTILVRAGKGKDVYCLQSGSA